MQEEEDGRDEQSFNIHSRFNQGRTVITTYGANFLALSYGGCCSERECVCAQDDDDDDGQSFNVAGPIFRRYCT